MYMKEFYTFYNIYIYKNVYSKPYLTNYWLINKDKNHNPLKNAISFNHLEQINWLFYILDLYDIPKLVKT